MKINIIDIHIFLFLPSKMNKSPHSITITNRNYRQYKKFNNKIPNVIQITHVSVKKIITNTKQLLSVVSSFFSVTVLKIHNCDLSNINFIIFI